MNLNRLFEIQEKLDNRIVEEKQLHGRHLLDEKILALQVELGELANEWRGFKFWSEDREPRTYEANPDDVCEVCSGEPVHYAGERIIGFCNNCDGVGVYFHNPLLEEYVDCLHFILSIGLGGGYDKIELSRLHNGVLKDNVSVYKESDVTLQFNELFFAVTGHVYHDSFDSYEKVFLYFIALGEQLGFSWEQIEQAYLVKNEINHERQENGY